MKDNLLEQARALMEDQGKLLNQLEELRSLQVKVSSAAEEAKENMMRVHRDKTLMFSQFPEISESPDPKTGKTNKDWSQMLLDQKLETDDEYMTALGAMYSFQNELAQINADILNAVERLNVTKTQSRLISAMLEVLEGV